MVEVVEVTGVVNVGVEVEFVEVTEPYHHPSFCATAGSIPFPSFPS